MVSIMVSIRHDCVVLVRYQLKWMPVMRSGYESQWVTELDNWLVQTVINRSLHGINLLTVAENWSYVMVRKQTKETKSVCPGKVSGRWCPTKNMFYAPFLNAYNTFVWCIQQSEIVAFIPFCHIQLCLPGVLWYCWLGDKKGTWSMKTSASKLLVR